MTKTLRIKKAGGGYEGREGIRVHSDGHKIFVDFWYDGGVSSDVVLEMTLEEFVKAVAPHFNRIKDAP